MANYVSQREEDDMSNVSPDLTLCQLCNKYYLCCDIFNKPYLPKDLHVCQFCFILHKELIVNNQKIFRQLILRTKLFRELTS